jgi:transcriptional regulator GlxA family with amidase domain
MPKVADRVRLIICTLSEPNSWTFGRAACAFQAMQNSESGSVPSPSRAESTVNMPAQVKSQSHEAIKRALRALEARPDYGWSVDELASITGVSTRHLRRIFSKVLGATPKEFLRSVRMHRAARLLADRPGLQVKDVMKMVGFADASHFRRDFQASFGVSPALISTEELLKRHRLQGSIPPSTD